MDKVRVAPAVKWSAIALMLAQGVIHLYEAPEMYGEVPYLGVLFVASMIGAAVASYGMLWDARWGWGLGLATAGLPLLGYLLSRTIGIPLFRENSLESFLEPLGLAAVAVEAIYVALAVRVLMPAAERRNLGTAD